MAEMKTALTTSSISDELPDDGELVRWVTCDDLAAVVRQVPLADYSEEALESRFRDLDALEELARHHNAVIAAVYRYQTILPAKFGHVYPNGDALRNALLDTRDALIAQLERLEGCDEWAVHVYADPGAIERQLVDEQPTLREARQELDSAQPGRAYLLKRRLAVELSAMTERTIRDRTQAILNRLESLSLAAEVTPVGSPRNSKTSHEVLRTAFLVPRTNLDAFLETVEDADQEPEGVICARSGPWPPYSFAGLAPEG